jgi:hypothetical protein
LPVVLQKAGVARMKGVVAISVTIGMLWLADVLLNDGRYGQVLDSGVMSLIGN